MYKNEICRTRAFILEYISCLALNATVHLRHESHLASLLGRSYICAPCEPFPVPGRGRGGAKMMARLKSILVWIWYRYFNRFDQTD